MYIYICVYIYNPHQGHNLILIMILGSTDVGLFLPRCVPEHVPKGSGTIERSVGAGGGQGSELLAKVLYQM